MSVSDKLLQEVRQRKLQGYADQKIAEELRLTYPIEDIASAMTTLSYMQSGPGAKGYTASTESNTTSEASRFKFTFKEFVKLILVGGTLGIITFISTRYIVSSIATLFYATPFGFIFVLLLAKTYMLIGALIASATVYFTTKRLHPVDSYLFMVAVSLISYGTSKIVIINFFTENSLESLLSVSYLEILTYLITGALVLVAARILQQTLFRYKPTLLTILLIALSGGVIAGLGQQTTSYESRRLEETKSASYSFNATYIPSTWERSSSVCAVDLFNDSVYDCRYLVNDSELVVYQYPYSRHFDRFINNPKKSDAESTVFIGGEQYKARDKEFEKWKKLSKLENHYIKIADSKYGPVYEEYGPESTAVNQYYDHDEKITVPSYPTGIIFVRVKDTLVVFTRTTYPKTPGLTAAEITETTKYIDGLRPSEKNR